MNNLYKALNISKQSFHQKMDRELTRLSEKEQLKVLIYQIREDHPTIGCRDMYFKLMPSSMGRDAFEQFCKESGLMSRVIKNYHRTTNSNGVTRFDNLLIDKEITAINQVWVSDITYFELDGTFCYLTFIIDSFSRRIIGHNTSTRLLTQQTTLPSIKRALKTRKNQNLDGLIFHSDGGGQYYDKDFLAITRENFITNSMCEYAWENGKAERINGVIKNNYLKHRVIRTFDELVKEVDRSVQLYNQEKPHIGLQRKTPIQFENEYFSQCKEVQNSEKVIS